MQNLLEHTSKDAFFTMGFTRHGLVNATCAHCTSLLHELQS